MGKLRSNRVKRTPQTEITQDRYQYLGLEQVEPNLGDPRVGPSSVGVNPIKAGSFYQLAAIGEYPGERFWATQVGIGSTLGVISVYANNVLPNSAFERIHGLNFVGSGVTIETPPLELFDGIGIATIRFQINEVANQGDVGQVLYNGPSGFASGASDLYYYSNNVGIGTTTPDYKLDVIGDFRLNGTLNAGGSDGTLGQYLSATGTGITWSSFPILRTGFSTVATAGQTGFLTSYNVGFLDVYINGIRLNQNDYVATNGSSIILNNPCFGGEVIDILAYGLVSSGSGGGSGSGTIINNYGDSYWSSNIAGIHTLSNVGIGTTNPTSKLTVAGTVSATTFSGSGSALTGIVTQIVAGAGISVTGSTGIVTVSATGTGSGTSIGVYDETSFIGYPTAINFGSNLTVSSISSGIVTVTGSTADNYWVKTDVGIHTLSNVGIGTTNPTEKLTVFGDARVTGILTIGTSSITLDGTNNEIKIGSGVTIYGDTGGISLNGSQVITSVSNSYNQVGILTGSFAVNLTDRFGSSVATSADGNTIIVGAFLDEISGTSETGVAYVFDRVGNSFNQVGILTGSFTDPYDFFGTSVATSSDGNTIVVGAYLDEVGATVGNGVVYVFDRVGNSFNQVGILTGFLAIDTDDYFGFTVATSADGSTIVVGAYNDEIGETTGTGVVYVFDRVGNSFNQVGILTGSLAIDTDDYFGSSVAISADGSTIVVGADYDEISTEESSGVAYVFDRVGNSFNQVGILTGSLAGAYDYFGWPVTISADGKTIVVCAASDEMGETSNTGVAYVFDRVGNSFNQVGILTGSYSTNSDWFGWSVATSADGKTIVVGARYDEAPNTGDASGVAYIFKRVGNSFNQVGILTGSYSTNSDDWFGWSVATSADGKTIVVGAVSDEIGAIPDTGTAYVFDEISETYVGIGTTNPTSKLHVVGDARVTGILAIGSGVTLNGTNNEIKIGSGVTIYGDTGAISLNGSQVITSSSGNVNISGVTTSSEFIGGGSDLRNLSGTHLVSYASASDISNSSLSISGISTYNQVGILTGPLTVLGEAIAISADGKTVIVSVTSEPDSGAVYVFDRVGNSFNQVGILTGSFAGPYDYFGWPAAISADGKTIVVGSQYDEVSATPETGVAYVFDRVGNSFNQVGILTGSYATNSYDQFGYSIDISSDGKTIVVGARSDEIGGTASGVVYVFDRVGNSFNEVGTLTGSLATNGDLFGQSVTISADGKTIVASARYDEISGTTATGLVYVFDRVGNSFNQVGILTGFYATDDGDEFGRSLDISADGKTIVVGVPYDEIGATLGTGVVYVFDRVGNSFNQVGILTGSYATNAGDNFGGSVATSADGKTIVVGASGDEIGATLTTGVAYVFKRIGNSFNQVGILTGSFAIDAGDIFGYSVATSADGKTIVVGAYNDEIGATPSTGVVYVFDEIRETYLYSTPSGNIGIGTTNPTEKLTVFGDARVTGILTIGTSSITLDGTNNEIKIGSGVTIYGDTGAISLNGSQVITSSSGGDLTNLNASNLSTGIVPAARITSTNALSVGGDLFVSGNISFGGTTTQLNTTQLTFSDPDLVLGIGTTSTFNPTDNTANHGGIAVASTEGNPLVNLNISPLEVLPNTYKKFMWFKNNTSGLGTDAWLSNFAVGIGSTQFPNGTRFASGSIQFGQDDINVVRHINSSGIISATSFVGNGSGLTGIITQIVAGVGISVTGSTGIVTVTGSIADNYWIKNTVGIHTLSNVGIGTTNPLSNLHVIGDGRFTGVVTANTFIGNLTGTATTAGVSTSVIGGIGSITQLSVSGISTFTNGPVLIGAATSTGTALQRLQVTGGAHVSGNLGIGTTNPLSNLHVVDGLILSQAGAATTQLLQAKAYSTQSGAFSIEDYNRYQFFSITGDTSILFAVNDYSANTRFVVTPTGNVGVGTTTPTSKLHVIGDGRFTGVVTATTFSGSGSALTGIVTQIVAGAGISVTGSTGIVTVSATGTGSGTSIGVYDDTSFIGYPTAINFGPNLSVSSISSGIVTVSATGAGSTADNYWVKNTVGIHTLSNVGIGTTNPTSKLTVSGTVSATSFVGDGSGLTGLVGIGTGVYIQENQNPLGAATTINFTGSGISTITVSSNVATINISGSSGTDISPVMMSMIF